MTVVTRLDTRRLDAIIARNPVRAAQIVRSAGHQVEAEWKVRAPVDTGAYQNSIHVEGLGRFRVRVADGVEYGIYQELGFHHWRSGQFIQNPSLVPAVEAVRPRWRKMWRDLI